MLGRLTLAALLVLGACGDDDDDDDVAFDAGADALPPTDPSDLRATLEDLAAFGEKRVGTQAGADAADYLMDRMDTIGLQNLHFEEFQVPMWQLDHTSLEISIDGVAVSPTVGHDVFYSSGTGTVDAEVVWVNVAMDGDLAGVDLTGKIALVRRSTTFHRSSQARNVAAAGAAAMIYISTAPDNLRQVGTVSLAWEEMIPIPAISLGVDDGAELRDAIDAGSTVTAVLDVQASIGQGTGRNVVGVIAGEQPEQILIGAHYDTWFTGSADNGSGTTALLALADRLARSPMPRYTLVFIAYDGEEVALFGGYDYLRKHHFVDPDPILAVVNFEMPAALDSTLSGLARSRQPVLEDGLRFAGLNFLYPLFVTLDVIPGLFGGVIPTDIQGMYRAGIPTVSTAADSAYYHTVEDTPDNVDTMFLASAVDAFHLALDSYMGAEPDAFDRIDDSLWQAEATAAPRSAGQPLVVTVTVTDATGAPIGDAEVVGDLLYDDFSYAGRVTAVSGADGKATLTFDAADADLGGGDRYVHVTAGEEYPLVETIVVLE